MCPNSFASEGVSVTRNLAAQPLCSFSGPDASLAGLDPGELIAIPWSQFSPQQTTPAARFTFLFKDLAPGVYPVELRFHHWITGKVEGFARTTITVEA